MRGGGGGIPEIIMRGEGFHVLSYHLLASYLSYWSYACLLVLSLDFAPS